MLSARVLVIAAVLLAGCGSAATSAPTPATSPTPAPRQLAGTLTLKGNGVITFDTFPDGHREQGDCIGTGGYNDIHTGTPVLAKDEAGKIVGSGQLTVDKRASDNRQCVYYFGFPMNPGTFYTFTIGSRGGPTYSAADVTAAGYVVDLSLGN